MIPLVIRVGVYPHREEETTAWEKTAFEKVGLGYEFHDRLTTDARGQLRGAVAVISSGVVWDADAIRLLASCRVLVSCSVGLDGIDTGACAHQGIAVINMPTICTDEVADHTLALILASIRKIPALTERVHAGRWDRSLLEPMPRLKGLTLGLVGLGRIGRAVALRAASFGFTVIGHDPYAPVVPGIASADLAVLCETSDVISLHVPLVTATEGIIGERELATMKPTAILVNTSRGRLVDQGALVEALRERRLAGAALDVLQNEPPDPNEPLLMLDNVILTPHAGGYSDDVVWDIPRAAVESIIEALRPELPERALNGS